MNNARIGADGKLSLCACRACITDACGLPLLGASALSKSISMARVASRGRRGTSSRNLQRHEIHFTSRLSFLLLLPCHRLLQFRLSFSIRRLFFASVSILRPFSEARSLVRSFVALCLAELRCYRETLLRCKSVIRRPWPTSSREGWGMAGPRAITMGRRVRSTRCKVSSHLRFSLMPVATGQDKKGGGRNRQTALTT